VKSAALDFAKLEMEQFESEKFFNILENSNEELKEKAAYILFKKGEIDGLKSLIELGCWGASCKPRGSDLDSIIKKNPSLSIEAINDLLNDISDDDYRYTDNYYDKSSVLDNIKKALKIINSKDAKKLLTDLEL
jgi:hypothetical protein